MAERTHRNGAGRGGETAAHYLVGGVPKVRPEHTVGEVLTALRGRHFDTVEIVCVIDSEDRLLGCVPIANLIALPLERPMGDAMDPEFPRVLPDVDQEKVASLALHHVLNAIPVVDRHGRLLGVVPNESLLHILRREHVEDLHRIAGIGRETHRAREAIESPPLRRARHRLPWMLGRLGSDPAYGSGPLATIIRDVLSLLIYFLTVSAIVL